MLVKNLWTLVVYAVICGTAFPTRVGSNAAENNMTLPSTGLIGDFPCTDLAPSPEPPVSAHRLRPADIKVVAALGDSVTAAFGAASTNIINLIVESRGLSWTVGYERPLSEQVTLASILREFNPNLKGGSTGNGGASSANAGLNVAISGAIASGMNGQARTLVSRMRADPSIDYENDWKLVSLWIGGNDLCAVCSRPDNHTPRIYVDRIREALETLFNDMPRVFVNLILIIDVTRLGDMQTARCSQFPGNIRESACSCGTTRDRERMEFTQRMAQEYQLMTESLAREPHWAERDDFAVVVQPFFKETTIPRLPNGEWDDSYFGADCFHFSAKAHAAGATALWNNMLEPVGSKSLEWVVGQDLKCPTANSPFLFTQLNSGLNATDKF